jgi:hypothetical protein
VVCLERGPLNLVGVNELLERESTGSGLENRDQRPCGAAAVTT